MNSANESLRSIRNQKAIITKAYEEAKEKLDERYAADMAILDKEEHDWLEQFDDIPIEDIYEKEPSKGGINNMTNDAKQWHKIIQKQHDTRTELIEIEEHIRNAMINYLKEIGGGDKFSLTFESYGTVTLNCEGDLFDLEEIGGFCEVFNLDILINNRVVVENYMQDTTTIKTSYLFQTGKIKK